MLTTHLITTSGTAAVKGFDVVKDADQVRRRIGFIFGGERGLVEGASLADITPLLLGELGIGIVYGILGYLLFAVFEVVAKRRGTLEVF